MGKKFQGTTDSFTVSTALDLQGFNFGFGTLAAVVNFASVPASNSGIFITNLAVANAVDWYIAGTTLRLGWFDGTNFRETSSLVIVTGETLVIAATKASGTATPRMHMYRPSTNAWTHQDTGGTSPNGATVTQFMIGDSTNTIPLSCDLFQFAAWERQVMTDSEVERLSRIPEMNWERLDADFYLRFDSRNEAGDVVRSFGRKRVRQTSRSGTVRGTIVTPGSLGFCPTVKRR